MSDATRNETEEAKSGCANGCGLIYYSRAPLADEVKRYQYPAPLKEDKSSCISQNKSIAWKNGSVDTNKNDKSACLGDYHDRE